MVLFAPKDMRLAEREKPTPGPGEVLVQVKEVGVCASDVHWYHDGRIGDNVMAGPLVLGHEFAGIIAEVGPGVTNVKPGDRVAVEPGQPCFKCEMCASEDYNLCPDVKFCGTYPIDGAFREYIAWPANLVEPVPESVSMGEAAMLEPLGVGLYAVDIAGDMQGKRIAILGAGAIGLSMLQCAKAAGCGEAVVIDPIPERREVAARLGADRVFDAGQPGTVQAVKEIFGGLGPDIVFEAAGDNKALCDATEMTRPKGLIVWCGIPDNDDITISASVVRRKGLTIRLVRRSNKVLRRAIGMVAERKADAAVLVTHRFPLEKTVAAFELAAARKDGAIRVVIEVS
jgi:L-iditol 2-dehydrogenase